jgi:hypothetical protein
MMHFIRQIGERLAEATAVSAALQEDLELKQLFEKFTLGIALCFTLNMQKNSFNSDFCGFILY